MSMRSPPGRRIRDLVVLAGIGVLPALSLEAQTAGEALYRATCTACHSLGSDRVVGPGLAGVLGRRETSWLLSKITGPDRLLASGDTISTRLAAEHGMAMPNMGITEDQAESLLAYLFTAAPVDVAAAPPVFTAPPREADVLLGRALFEGRTRLDGRGPSCASCHGLTGAGVSWGGNLAVDLTGAYERLGGPAVQAILSSPPFPAMRGAYEGRPPTQPEVAALTAFMIGAGTDQAAAASPRNVGFWFFGAALLGTALLIGISSLVWRGRRTGPVYREMFERQIKSR